MANIVDIRGDNNKELVMRIVSDVQSKDTFFTDLNGFQVTCIGCVPVVEIVSILAA